MNGAKASDVGIPIHSIKLNELDKARDPQILSNKQRYLILLVNCSLKRLRVYVKTLSFT